MCTNKKRGYWPTHVPGDVIDSHMSRYEVGATDAIQGNLDGILYNIWAMKDAGYTMKMMATGGKLVADDSCKTTTRKWVESGLKVVKEFVYTLPFDWHFGYHHDIDDHNNLCHSLPSWEDTWVTQRWECRVFSFIIAVAEVNAYLAVRYLLGCAEMPMLLNFHQKLGWQLILTELHAISMEAIHIMCTAPHTPASTAITVGFMMPNNATNNMLAAGQTATTPCQNILFMNSWIMAVWLLPC